MGSCYSQRRTSTSSVVDLPFPSVGKNKPLKKKLPKWTYDVLSGPPLTTSELARMRTEFWETAPAFDGRKEIWDALHAAATALESDRDFGLAQAILDGASITLPRGSLTECYDELGTRYKIPVYCITGPCNIEISSSVLSGAMNDHLLGKNVNAISNDIGLSSSCCEDELTTTLEEEEELDGFEIISGIGGGKITQVSQSKGPPRIRPNAGTAHHATSQDTPSTLNITPGRRLMLTPPSFPHLSTTMERLTSVVCRLKVDKPNSRSKKVTNDDDTTPRSVCKDVRTLAVNDVSPITLKLRIGTSGTDYELVCDPRETVASAKRRIAKKILAQRSGRAGNIHVPTSDHRPRKNIGECKVKVSAAKENPEGILKNEVYDSEIKCEEDHSHAQAKIGIDDGLVNVLRKRSLDDRHETKPRDSSKKENNLAPHCVIKAKDIFEGPQNGVKNDDNDICPNSSELGTGVTLLLPEETSSKHVTDSKLIAAKIDTTGDGKVVTKRDVNRWVEAQRWLLSGKIIPNKVTIKEAKVPPGFVIQVALCDIRFE